MARRRGPSSRRTYVEEPTLEVLASAGRIGRSFSGVAGHDVELGLVVRFGHALSQFDIRSNRYRMRARPTRGMRMLRERTQSSGGLVVVVGIKSARSNPTRRRRNRRGWRAGRAARPPAQGERMNRSLAFVANEANRQTRRKLRACRMFGLRLGSLLGANEANRDRRRDSRRGPDRSEQGAATGRKGSEGSQPRRTQDRRYSARTKPTAAPGS